MHQTIHIYKLLDPRDSSVRYVGKTVNKLNIRLSQHCSNANFGISHRDNWILLLRRLGLRPIIELVEEANEANWEEREIFWIRRFKDLGCDLVNTTEGGDHGGNPRAAECARKMWANPIYRAKHSGENHHMKRPENRLKNKLAHLGFKHTEEAKQKISNAGKGHPAYPKQVEFARINGKKPKPLETRLKLAKTKSKISAEDCDKIRNERALGFKLEELALKYHISIATVSRVCNRKRLLDKAQDETGHTYDNPSGVSENLGL